MGISIGSKIGLNTHVEIIYFAYARSRVHRRDAAGETASSANGCDEAV